MLPRELHGIHWIKSTYSGNSGQCVEVADRSNGFVSARDSKAVDRPALVIGVRAWAEFIAGIRTGSVSGVG
ncbi:DUF397 domain-containing protein [Streptomyces sp. ISL-11]|uniref:DUF397 domain-containing protein n=1 Tax=Streptomyces sp. ISL-11 TaxID=2819174 RepID=UPI001BEB4973|nr:DUF397 domain-containing protein [Streptomyces sp. ISL-11]MBT2386645.1 DUF397 domain-containing protein [Streptomyces sp. ISL-11]